MAIVTIDFETFYSKDYSLKRMSETDYVLDPRFEVIMCAIKEGDAETRVLTGRGVRDAIERIDWENNALLAHNTRFDGAILAWHYGKTPGIYLDTMSMARAITHPVLGSSSLAALAKHFGLPPKGDAVVAAMGRARADFTPDELVTYADYCAHDTDLCRTIFDRLIKIFPHSELMVIDLALRMFIEPQAQLDPMKLAEHLNLVRAEREAAFARVSHIDRDIFSSNMKFADLLQSYGIDPPTKISPATGSETWALAKNDRAFKDLCADPDQPTEVQAVLACRVNAKSTIEETRTATLLNLAQRDWGRLGTHWMPVPYRYYGAHTGRFAGDGGYNFANLRRGSPIRDAITAPKGYRVVHRDASQIEARILAWLARCDTLTQAFAEGRDIYSEFATKFYGETVTKRDTLRRFTGKTAILSLGYGAGAPKFRHALYIGTGGVSVALTENEADELVRFYRAEYREIPVLWRAGNKALHRMIRASGEAVAAFPDTVELGDRCVYLPNSMAIQYPKLRNIVDPDTTGPAMVYDDPYGSTKRIYGAKLIENVTQALARIVVTDAMLRVYRETGARPFMSTYDSHDYIVSKDIAYEFNELLNHEFSVVPPWAAGLPLASEGGWGKTLLGAERGVNR
jgi:DNA polymerase